MGWSYASHAWIRSRQGHGLRLGGRGEFIEKYFETIGELRRRGFAVATMDWRGQGAPPGNCLMRARGTSKTSCEYEIDLETFMQQVVRRHCPEPYFAFTHSMGGAVVLRAAHAGKRWFERAVLVAPMIDFPHAWVVGRRAL